MFGHSSEVTKVFGTVATTAPPMVNYISGVGALGAIPLGPEITVVSITGASTATLADGVAGQRKTIILNAATSGSLVLTPAKLMGAAVTVTFAAAGNSVELVFTTEWCVVSLVGAVVA